MNDFQMTHLANDRINSLQAEAQRHRLANSARKTAARQRISKPRSHIRFSLHRLLGRAAA